MLKRIGYCVLTVALILGISGNVFAATSDSTTATVSVLKGDLFIDQPDATVDMGSVMKNGLIQTVKADLGTMIVGDYTGTGSGWHVTASATAFTQTNGTSGYTLPTNTFKINGVGTITQTVGGGTLPTVTSGSPWIIDSGAMSILSAGVGAGMGEFNVTFPAEALELEIDTAGDVTDPVVDPTTFQSTITWNIVTGP